MQKLVSLSLIGLGTAVVTAIPVALEVDYTLLRDHEEFFMGGLHVGVALMVIGMAVGVLAGVVEYHDRRHPKLRVVQEGNLLFDASLEPTLRRSWLRRCAGRPTRRASGPKPAPH